jgi:hypothetical protein
LLIESARFLHENVLEADSSIDIRNTTLSIVRTSEVALAVETEPNAGMTWALEYGAEIRDDLELRGIVVWKGSKGGRDG